MKAGAVLDEGRRPSPPHQRSADLEQTDRHGGPLPVIAIGAVSGLAWAAGLRGFMAQVAEDEMSLSWFGTFAWILAPGVAIGAILGWAEFLRRRGRRPPRWTFWSPLLFASVLLPGLVDPGSIFEGGVGGGAIGVPLLAMSGGYALSGRGRFWGRILCGLLALTAIPIWTFTVTSFGGSDLAVTTARGAWVAIYYWSFLAVFALGCAIPHRAVMQHLD